MRDEMVFRSRTTFATLSIALLALAALAFAALIAAPAALADENGDFFEAPTSPERACCTPKSVAVGDFNGDSNQDLATANSGSKNVTILLGDGSGDFTESATSPVGAGNNVLSVAIGEFDGDSAQDLAVVSGEPDHSVTILLGDGSGGFTESATSPVGAGDHPTEVAIGEFNGDPNQDLAVVNRVSDDVTILLGDGSGDFTESATSPEGAGNEPTDVAIGEFSGNSNQDLAIVNHSSNSVRILFGDGSGGFLDRFVEVGAVAPTSVAIGEFSGDSNQDLAVAGGHGTGGGSIGDVSIFLGDGSSGFTEPATSPERAGKSTIDVSISDFNGDSNQDLAIANPLERSPELGPDDVTILLGDGSGDFTEPATSPERVGEGPQAVAVGDFDGDQFPDLAVANGGDNSVTILLGDTEGADLSLTKSGPTGAPVRVGDDFTYTLVVSNAGPEDATSVTVTDTLPAEVAYRDAASDADCDETSPGTVECNVGDLPAEASDGIVIAVTATGAADPATNSASVAGTEDDPDPGNDSATAETTIEAAADLSLTKTDSADPVTVGDDFTYTLRVENAGPSDATGLTVSDSLPDEVRYDDAASDTRCDEVAQGSAVECDIGNLAADASDEVVVAVRATAGADPAVNTATANANESDPGGAETGEETVILVARCQGQEATIVGTPGDDELIGTSGDDVIHGRGGNDVIHGRGGDDVICGEAGEGELHGGGGDDLIVSGDDADRLFGGSGNDELRARGGDDFLRGGAGDDLLVGGLGDDELGGARGNDELRGGPGDDRIGVRRLEGDDRTSSGRTSGGARGDDLLVGGPGSDFIRGGRGADVLKGNGGADELRGLKGADTLRGQPGPDILRGGAGRDLCSGGPGRDRANGTCERVRGVP